MKKHRVASEVKEQIITRIKNEGVSVQEAAKEHGLSDSTIYGWLEKRVTGMPSILEVAKLRRERDELLRLIGEITLKLSEAQKKK